MCRFYLDRCVGFVWILVGISFLGEVFFMSLLAARG